ncbi:MAG: non-canonical purine NTP pyrophosphatase [Merdibacter sp.]
MCHRLCGRRWQRTCVYRNRSREIAPQISGENGFGYDPIFYYPPYHATLAEVSEEQKNAVSHRGRALAKLIAFLKGEGQ